MAEAKRIERPLSPFMFVQYYRLQLTAVSSVLIRITGNALMVAVFLLIWWLLALAAGPEYFETAEWWITSYLGDLVMFGSLWAIAEKYVTNSPLMKRRSSIRGGVTNRISPDWVKFCCGVIQ